MDIEGFLQEGSKLWRFLVDNTVDLICVTDEAGIIRYANPAHLDLLEYEPQELAGRSFFDLVFPEDMEMALSTFETGVGQRRIMRTTGRYLRKGGGALWVEATAMPLTDGEGRVFGGVIISRDVTELVESERLLRIQRDLALELARTASLEEALDLSLQAVLEACGFDGGGIYLVNEETGGLDLACSRGLSDAFVAEVRSYPAGSPSAGLVMAGKPVYTEYEELEIPVDDVRRREGLKAIAVVPVVHRGRVIGDVNVASRSLAEVPERARSTVETMAGQIGQAIARARLDSALRESEARYRAVFEASGAAMCVLDGRGNVVFANREFCDLSGRLPASPEGGLHLREVLAGRGEEEVMRAVEGLKAGDGEAHRHLFLELACAGGGTRDVLAGMGLMPGREAAVLSFIDVTREREYERELEERARQLADFLAVASHELRHPITLIRGYSESMMEAWREGREEGLEEVVAAVEAGSRRLMRLVEDLLDVSRIEGGRFPVRKGRAPLEPVLRDAVEEIRERYARWEIAVESGEEGMPSPWMDPERVRQLLVILLENAVHFSPPESRVEVKLEEGEGRAVRVSVADRGSGVPDGDRDRVFERFYQVEDLDHHSVPGLGMGLFIAASIVEAHGGRIWNETRPGGGTVFRFTLPLEG